MENYMKEVKKITHHGREIYGVACLPKDKRNYPMVIFSHGYNGSYSNFEEYGEYLAAKGIGTYYFDFCGGSAGARSSMATDKMSVFTQQEDLEAVLSEVQKWKEVDKENIFAFGVSQGGLVTALTAEAHKQELRGVLLLYPAFCIPDDWRRKYHTVSNIPEQVPFWGMTIGKSYIESAFEINLAADIGGYDREVLIFHGDQDDIVSQDYSLNISKQYQHARTVIFPGEGHGFTEAATQKVLEMTWQFINENRLIKS